MEIIDRIGKYKQPGREWYTRAVNTIKVFSIHHDAIPHGKTADQALNQIKTEHVNRGWPGISYHYYIHSDGKIYQLNKHTEVTWVDGINWDCIGIVLNGYFHPDVNNKPTQAQLTSLKELLDNLSTQHPEFPADQSGVFGHRERAATACPGDALFPYVKEYREKLGQVNWGGTPTPEPPPNADAERALAILNESKIEFNHSTLEGAARAGVGAQRDIKTIKGQLEEANKKLQISRVQAQETVDALK